MNTTTFNCPNCGQTDYSDYCDHLAHTPLVDPAWVERTWGHADAHDVIAFLLELLSGYQSDRYRQAGSDAPHTVDSLAAWTGEPEESLLLRFGPGVFRVRVERVPDADAERLLLLEIHDCEQQDAALKDGKTPEERMRSWLRLEMGR